MSTVNAQLPVNDKCSITGAIGCKDLHKFRRDYSSPRNQPLLLRRDEAPIKTVGITPLADEIQVSFVHAKEMPPLSLDLDPTNKFLEISLVGTCVADQSMVFLGTWGQPSVLVKIGILNPKRVKGGRVRIVRL